MPCLVCCVVQLQLPGGVVDQAFPGPLYVRRVVVGVVAGGGNIPVFLLLVLS